MREGGFDCVVGNPPYVRIQHMKDWAPFEAEHYKGRYKSAGTGNYDIYVVFIERGLGVLKNGGRLGYIVPHKFFNAKYGEPLRTLIAEGRHLSGIVHFGDQQVFDGAANYTCLLFLEKNSKDQFQYAKVSDLTAWQNEEKAAKGTIAADNAGPSEWNFAVGEPAALFRRLSKMPLKLRDVAARIYQGPITSADTVYLFKHFRAGKRRGTITALSEELQEWVTLERGALKPVVRSGDAGRYYAVASALSLFPYELKDCTARLLTPAEMKSSYGLAWSYLNRNKKLLQDREGGRFRDADWYRFGRTQNLGMWEQPKLMIP